MCDTRGCVLHIAHVTGDSATCGLTTAAMPSLTNFMLTKWLCMFCYMAHTGTGWAHSPLRCIHSMPPGDALKRDPVVWLDPHIATLLCCLEMHSVSLSEMTYMRSITKGKARDHSIGTTLQTLMRRNAHARQDAPRRREGSELAWPWDSKTETGTNRTLSPFLWLDLFVIPTVDVGFIKEQWDGLATRYLESIHEFLMSCEAVTPAVTTVFLQGITLTFVHQGVCMTCDMRVAINGEHDDWRCTMATRM